jgi:hypothetical protein
VLETAEELGLQVVPIGATRDNIQGVVSEGVADSVSPFLWWAVKPSEPVPEEVLKTLGQEAVLERASKGLFKKVYNHPLLKEGRNDAKLWVAEEDGVSTGKIVEGGH